ncbi:hypothetical protein MMC07_007906 [Pseudocyphellaria aurata]|nr:hypothetical protein [Pseudocyphellaria aurata]
MSQAFMFGFDNDVVEEDGPKWPKKSHTDTRETSAMQMKSQLEEPKSHSLQEMLSLLPSSISYSTLAINVPNETSSIQLLRRELFDIRAQLMAEDSHLGEANQFLSNPIAGLSSGDDLTPGVYEGGFKTWECAIDLAQYLVGQWSSIAGVIGSRGLHVIELGAGTAVPSLTLLHLVLTNSSLPSSHPPFQFTLADYNPSVLHLSTIPNFLLTHMLHTSHSRSLPFAAPTPTNSDLEINSALLSRFSSDLSSRNIYMSAISGPWSPTFFRLVSSQTPSHHATSFSLAIPPTAAPSLPPFTLILASETIYSPRSLQPFTNTLFDLLDAAAAHPDCGQSPPRALVAAKKFYFGVGGGVEEFLTAVKTRGGTADVVWESGGGVGRVILEVRRS